MDDKLKDRLLLDNKEDAEKEALLEEFMKLYSNQNAEEPQNDAKYRTVEPTAEFCIKTRNEKGDKLFLNICTADHIPTPDKITDEELVQLLESDDPSRYRVPMSLGEPHAEVDKSGKGCTAYDIIISKQFCNKIQSNNLFMGFFMSVIMEGISNKYDVQLSREWVRLKNKRSMGKVLAQHIRASAKPKIEEIYNPSSASESETVGSSQTETTIKPVKAKEPKYRIVQEPVEGHPDYLIAEVELPEIKTSNALQLDIGEDCIILNTRSKAYYLELYLPFDLVQGDCGAQFDKRQNKLTITMPVQPLNS